MPTFTSGQVVEVVVRGQENNQAITNIIHYRQSAVNPGGSLADLRGLCLGFRTKWIASVLPWAPTSYEVVDYTATIITGRTLNPRPQPNPIGSWTPYILTYGAQELVDKGVNFVGTFAGAASPTFVALGVRWFTELRARMFRGGSRLRVGNEATTTLNIWDKITFLDPIQADITSLRGDIDTDTVPAVLKAGMCIFGRRTYLNALAAGNPVLIAHTSYVTQHVLNPFVSSQVSRKQRFRLQ